MLYQTQQPHNLDFDASSVSTHTNYLPARHDESSPADTDDSKPNACHWRHELHRRDHAPRDGPDPTSNPDSLIAN